MKKEPSIWELNSVRKKVLLLSKLAGGAIVVFYLVTEGLSDDRSVSFWLWLILLIATIIAVDLLLGRLISRPLGAINEAARRMAQLDFSARCDVQTGDEFGQLSDSLNSLSGNLQDALAKLEAANARLEQDVRQERLLLAQRKELADTLSHEMKTPLGIIRAYTEGLKEEPDSEKRERYMDSILSATDRMNRLIVSLLDLSALEAGAIQLAEERFDFVELAETVGGRLLLDTPGAAYQLSYELPEEKVYVRADSHRMEQVLENLIENAKKHTRPGGGIRLSITRAGASLRFSVYNEGEAIPTQELPKIWTKFYRGEGTLGGSGLGLAIVAQILSMYGADYGAFNGEDGVEFYFQFPVVP